MRNYTILWADDDQDDLLLIREVLQELDYHASIIEVGNGQEALDYLHTIRQEHTPSLIVLDMNMPVLNGKQTLAQIKADEELNSIPVVMFTTSDSKTDQLYCNQFETEMITKPAAYIALKNVVEKLLRLCDKKHSI